MKSWVSHRRLAAGVFAFVMFSLSTSAAAAVGRTVGTYQVSPSGAATYTIPIWVPRGPNGLQPEIALSYNSQSGNGNGYLGVGWSLSGLGAIYRCTQTYAQDPQAAPVSLTMSDVFCMDGQRLRLTGGSYGAADSTYQTEVANFSNVTAYGAAGNGPAYFEVQGRNGLTYEYGNSAGSQVLASGTITAWIWYLDKVTDRAGNTMAIVYCAAATPNCQSPPSGANSVVPSTISWTPSSYGASTYNYTIKFAYTNNVPQSSVYGYVGGTPYSNTSLLASISIVYNGSTTKQYALSYQQSSTTGRDELTQVKECADAGASNCLAPTQFTYQSGQIGVSTSPATALSASSTWLTVHNDFTGDGLNDLAYCNIVNGNPGVIYVAFASQSGYGTPMNTGLSCSKQPLYGDLTASGKDGILVPNGTDWWYYTWNGTAFTGQDTGLVYDSTVYQYVLADVNGDGLPDLVSMAGTSGSYAINVRLNTSQTSASFSVNNSQWAPATSGAINLISNTDSPGGEISGSMKRLDFNGDGRQDLLLQVLNRTVLSTYELISGTSSFAFVLVASQNTANHSATTFLDFNSDGCTDYASYNVIYISACNGTVAQQIDLGSTAIIGAMDWDGDGRTDILTENFNTSPATIGVYLSEGNGISSLQTTAIPYNPGTYFALDQNGDGLDDLGFLSGSGGVNYYVHSGTGQKPDLLSSVTDGYGNRVAPTYTSIVQGAYSDYAIAPTYPYKLYKAPLHVVSNVVFSDPANPPSGTYSQSYNYVGSWTNVQGRGFSNFIGVQMLDSRSGIWRQACYENKFPFSGMQACTGLSLDQAGTQLIRYGYGNHALITLDGTANNERYFIYQNHQTSLLYQVSWAASSGSSTGPLIQTDTATYQYDNDGNVTSLAVTKTDNDSGSPYVGDSWTTTFTNTPDVSTSTWCLGLLSEQQISYSASDGSPSVTRTWQYTPDTTNCRYTGVTTEPSSGTYEVSESLGYDSFGNINSDTITGIGMTARHTAANWGTTGQFPMSLTDPLNETTNFKYNFSYGLVSGETDPNGLTTSWQYGDGFGRLTQETRPDGTYTQYMYNNCGSSGGCLEGANTLALSHYVYNTDGTLETDGTTYFDELARPIVWNKMMLNGTGYDRDEVRYDSLGRIVRRAAPCVWSAVTTPKTYSTTMSYDVLNRLTQVQRPINQNDSALQTTGYSYDGLASTITDPNGHARTVIDDVNGRLRQAKDAGGYSIILGYDAAGTKTSVADSLGNTLWTGTYAYGISPFLLSETDVDRGTLSYKVDALGERVRWTNGKGQTTYASYDALSRLGVRQEPDLYTRWIWGTSASSHNVGKLVNVCTGAAYPCTSSYYYSESDTYDSLARLSQRAISIPAIGTSTYTWQYNATTGLLDTLTYPVSTSGKALQLKYGYQAGILASITDVLDSPNVTIWKANVEDPAGHITQDTLGNGLVTTRAYDAVTQRLSSVQSGPGGGASVQNQGFLYDEAGNVTQRQDNKLGLNEDFYYDSDNRLSYSTLNGTQNLSLTYDEMGNITSRSDVAGGATWTYDPVHLHEVTQAGSSAYQYAYDVDGNVTSRQGSSITWSSYDYPTLINDTAAGESVSLSYGPDRRAFSEQTTGPSGTEMAYHVGRLLDVVTSGGVTDYRHYVYAGNEPVAIDSRKSSGTNAFYYLLSDHQGTISAITNTSGAVVVNESFAAYGARRNPTTWSGSPSSADLTTIAGLTRHGYTFQSALGSMGINDMVGRVEDAVTGRFLSPDPYVIDPSNTQDWNRYSYVYNSPLTFVDPSGFFCGFPSSSEDFFKTGVGICSDTLLPDLIPRDPTGLPDPWAPEHGDTRGGPDPHGPGSSGGAASGSGGRTSWPRTQSPGAQGQQIPCLPGVMCDAEPPPSDQLQEVTVTATYLSPYLQGVAITLDSGRADECVACWIAIGGAIGAAVDAVLVRLSASAAESSAPVPVFWSGGTAARNAAAAWAKANGGMTLEMSQAGQELTELTQGMPWEEAAPLWQSASADFASQAVGEAHVFLGPAVSADSIFSTVEAPALVGNPNVTAIVFH